MIYVSAVKGREAFCRIPSQYLEKKEVPLNCKVLLREEFRECHSEKTLLVFCPFPSSVCYTCVPFSGAAESEQIDFNGEHSYRFFLAPYN